MNVLRKYDGGTDISSVITFSLARRYNLGHSAYVRSRDLFSFELITSIELLLWQDFSRFHK